MSSLRSQGEERPDTATSMASTNSNTQQCQQATHLATLGREEDELPTEEAIALKKHRQSVQELLGENEDGSPDHKRLMDLIKKSRGIDNLRPPRTSLDMKIRYNEAVFQRYRSQAARNPRSLLGRGPLTGSPEASGSAVKTKEYPQPQAHYQPHNQSLLAPCPRQRNSHISNVSPDIYLPSPVSKPSPSAPRNNAPAQEQQGNSGADRRVEVREKQDKWRDNRTWAESPKQMLIEGRECHSWTKSMKQTVIQCPKSAAAAVSPQPETIVPALQNGNADIDDPNQVRPKRKYTKRKQVDEKQDDAAPARQKRKYNKKSKGKEPMVQAPVPVNHAQQQAPNLDSATPPPWELQSTFQSQYQAPHFSSATSEGETPPPGSAHANAQAFQESAHPAFAVIPISSSSSLEPSPSAAASGQPESSRQNDRPSPPLPTSLQEEEQQPSRGRSDSTDTLRGENMSSLPSPARPYMLDSRRDVAVNRRSPLPARLLAQNKIKDWAQSPLSPLHDPFASHRGSMAPAAVPAGHQQNMTTNMNMNMHWTGPRHQRTVPYGPPPVNGHPVSRGYQNPSTHVPPSMCWKSAPPGPQVSIAHPHAHMNGYNMGGGYQHEITHAQSSMHGYNVERGYQHTMTPAQSPAYMHVAGGRYQYPMTYAQSPMYTQFAGQGYQYQNLVPQMQDPMHFNQFQQPVANVHEFGCRQGPAFECGFGQGPAFEIGYGLGNEIRNGIWKENGNEVENAIGQEIGNETGIEVGDEIENEIRDGDEFGNEFGKMVENEIGNVDEFGIDLDLGNEIGDEFGSEDGNQFENEYGQGQEMGTPSADGTQSSPEPMTPLSIGPSALAQIDQDDDISGSEE